MGGVLEEGLLPLRLVFDIPAEPKAQQTHDGGDRKQHREEHPVQRYDIVRDGTDVYVHDIGVRLFPIVLLLLRGHEDQVMIVHFEGIALIECDITSGTVFQQLFLQQVDIPIPCVGLVAVLQLQKDDAGCKEVSLLPILIIVRFVIEVGNGSILIFRFVEQRLFCLVYKVGRNDHIYRQHKKSKQK